MASSDLPEGAQSVGRALRILKAFSRRRPELGLAELAERLGLARTTAHRLVAALISEGFLVRSGTSGAYRLGPATIALGTLALQSNDLRAQVQPELERLAAESGETASLEVMADGRILILSEVTGPHLVSVAAETGTLWPLHATSTGKAILAALPDEERRRLLVGPLKRYTATTVTGRRQLEKQLETIRARGYATAVEELEPGAVAVAVVLRNAAGEPLGAISVGGPANRLDEARLAELGGRLVEVADRLAGEVV